MTVGLQLNIPQATLLDAANALEPDDLDRLLDALLRVRARRIAPSISATDMELVRQIYAAVLTPAEQTRLQTLSNQLERSTVTDDEHAELLTLADKSEALNVQRMQVVAKLAMKRGQSLRDVMADLGILGHGTA